MIVLSNATNYSVLLNIRGYSVNLRPGDFIKRDDALVDDITSPEYNVDVIAKYIDSKILVEKTVYEVPPAVIKNRKTFSTGWIIYGTCTIVQDNTLQSPEPEIRNYVIFRPGFIVYRECLVYNTLIAIEG